MKRGAEGDAGAEERKRQRAEKLQRWREQQRQKCAAAAPAAAGNGKGAGPAGMAQSGLQPTSPCVDSAANAGRAGPSPQDSARGGDVHMATAINLAPVGRLGPRGAGMRSLPKGRHVPAQAFSSANGPGAAEEEAERPRIRMYSLDGDEADDEEDSRAAKAGDGGARAQGGSAGQDLGKSEGELPAGGLVGGNGGVDASAAIPRTDPASTAVDPLDAFMSEIVPGDPGGPTGGGRGGGIAPPVRTTADERRELAGESDPTQAISLEEIFDRPGPAGWGSMISGGNAFHDVMTDTPMTDQSGDEGAEAGAVGVRKRMTSHARALRRANEEAAADMVDVPALGDDSFHDAFIAALRRQREGADVGAPAVATPAAADAEERIFGDDDGEDEDDGEADGGEASEDDQGGGGDGAYGTRKRKELPPVDHSKIDYAPFNKNFLRETDELRAMSPEEVVAARTALEVRVHGKRCPKPISRWSQAGLGDAVLAVLRKKGFDKPFPIQAQVLPALMAGRDVIGIAKTGSGKTLAYTLPMLRHALDQPPLANGDGPIGLVMVPTRELAAQVHHDASAFAKACGARFACIYGGTAVKQQIDALKRGAEAVVCTPGRMIDMLTANSGRVTNLRRVTYVILDEADRMFDLGFEPQIKRILGNIRPDRQMALFSATFPRAVDALARDLLRKPVQIIVGGVSVVSSTITQHVEVVTADGKQERLLQVLNMHLREGQVLVFVDRHDAADDLFSFLIANRYPSLSLHGRMDQADRDSVISDFKSGAAPVLVATSVAARGLDVRNLVCVVNYDAPTHYEDYVHRVGRTGRAGRTGDAYTFVTPDEEKQAPDLVRALELAKQEIPDDLAVMAAAYADKKKANLLSRDQAKRQNFRQSGRVGYGFDQKALDEEAVKERKARKMRLRAEGVEVEDSESDDGLGGDEDEPSRPVRPSNPNLPVAPPPPTAGATTTQAPPPAAPSVPAPPVDPIAAAAAMAARSLAAQLNLADPQQAAVRAVAAARTGQPCAAATAGATAVAGAAAAATEGTAQGGISAQMLADAQQRAHAAAARISQSLSLPAAPPPPAGVTVPAPSSGPRRWKSTEIEINDYPKTARWKVTHKDSLLAITDFTRAAITTKGVYTQPGSKPPPGERKLYLLIEAEEEAQLKEAKKEIKRILDETSKYAAPEERTQGGRYTV